MPHRVARDLGPTQSSAPLGDSRAERWRAHGSLGTARESRTHVATKAIVGEKVGMTQIWDDQNRAIPVTVLRSRPSAWCR